MKYHEFKARIKDLVSAINVYHDIGSNTVLVQYTYPRSFYSTVLNDSCSGRTIEIAKIGMDKRLNFRISCCYKPCFSFKKLMGLVYAFSATPPKDRVEKYYIICGYDPCKQKYSFVDEENGTTALISSHQLKQAESFWSILWDYDKAVSFLKHHDNTFGNMVLVPQSDFIKKIHKSENK